MIKRISISFILFFLMFNITSSIGQEIKGKLVDPVSKQEVAAVQVSLKGTDYLVFTNGSGHFMFNDVKNGKYTLVASINQVVKELANFEVLGKDIDLGVLDFESPQPALVNDISIIDISDLSGIENENDNYSSALGAGRDQFVNAAAYNLSSGRFRPRGYFNEDSEMMMNGMVMNDQDDGRVQWNEWSGLNDVLRNQTQILNLQSNDYTFGGIGGGTFVDLRAASQREGTKAVYTLSNRSYQHRLMITHSTGLMKNGWAFSGSLSHRYGTQGYIKGTYFQGTSFFASIDRKINDHHNLNLVVFGAPMRRGRSTGSIQEMNDLSGSNFYNGNWGYQNGEIRNSREYRINQPVAMIRHDWKISHKTNVLTNVGFQWGTYASTRINQYNAPDPRPDYYRRLPSYATDPATKELITNYLKADENNRQVDWQNLYEANSTNFATIANADGISGNNLSGKLAAYMLEEEHSDNQKLSFNSIINSQVTDNLNLTGGIQYLKENVHYYRQLDDLLGADFFVDYNTFAIRDYPNDPNAQQNDLNRPNRIIREGDKYGHDYNVNTARASAWTQAILKTSKFDYFAAINVINQSFYREGFVKNGLFPESSLGKSETQSFFNYGVKGGITYKLNGRNYFLVNGSYRTRAPFANESFVSPRNRDQVVNGLTNEKITAGEVSYLARYTRFKGRITGFYSEFKDKLNNDVYYHEEFQTFVNYIQTGINRRHMGVELGFEYNLNTRISFTAAGSLGQYIYTSRPSATISRDNSAEGFVEGRTIYINNYYVPGMPQQAGTIGIRYNSSKFWFFNVNVNAFANNYLSFNPDRRTAEAVSGINPVEQSALYQSIIAEEKLPNAYTVDIFCGKSFRFKDRSTLNINLNVSNVLNNQNFKTGGFEQLRFDIESRDVNKFPPRYFYAFGTNYSLNFSYVFAR